MTNEQILDRLHETFPDVEVLTADGFHDAIIGIVEGACRPSVVCYDYRRCVEILIEDGMSEDEAEEYLAFNTTSAYMGEYTPMFLHRWRDPVNSSIIEPSNGPECPSPIPTHGGSV